MAPNFLRWGGIETLMSYGVDVGGGIRRGQDLARELNQRMPDSHRRFLSRLRPCHVEGDYFFSHAGARPGIALERQSGHDLMWIREECHCFSGSYGKVIVHGHTPQARVDVQPNRINVDTHAYASGVLSAVVLEGNEYRLLQVASPDPAGLGDAGFA